MLFPNNIDLSFTMVFKSYSNGFNTRKIHGMYQICRDSVLLIKTACKLETFLAHFFAIRSTIKKEEEVLNASTKLN